MHSALNSVSLNVSPKTQDEIITLLEDRSPQSLSLKNREINKKKSVAVFPSALLISKALNAAQDMTLPMPNATTDKHIEKLKKSATSLDLKTFMLKDNKLVTNYGLAMLFGCEFASDIENLVLKNCFHVNDQTIDSLIQSGRLINLRRLDLSSCVHITNEVIKKVAKTPSFVQLEYLNISNCQEVDDQGLEYLAGSTFLINLTTLKLNEMRHITERGIKSLGNAKSLTLLQSLSLEDCQWMNKKCFLTLIESPLMLHIHKLNLNKCIHVSSKSLTKLINSPASTNLKVLKIIGLRLNKNVDEALATSTFLNLEELEISNKIKLKKFLKSSNARTIRSLCFDDEGCPYKEKMKKYHWAYSKLNRILLSNHVNTVFNDKAQCFDTVEALTLQGLESADVYKMIFSNRRGISHAENSELITDMDLEESDMQLSKLKILQIHEAPKLHDESLTYLNVFIQTRMLSNLKQIRFYNTRINDETLRAVSRANIDSLDVVILDTTPLVTSLGIRYLVISPVCTGLKKLGLKNFKLAEDAYKYISSSEDMKNLEKVLLKNMDLNYKCIKPIIKSRMLDKLTTLSIKNNSTLDDKCAETLKSPILVSSLKTIKMDTNNEISFEGWKMLRNHKIIQINISNFKYDEDLAKLNPKFSQKGSEAPWNEIISYYVNPLRFTSPQKLSIVSSEYINDAAISKILLQADLDCVHTLEVNGVKEVESLFSSINNSHFAEKLTSLHLTNCTFSQIIPISSLTLFKHCPNIIELKLEECANLNDSHLTTLLNLGPNIQSLHLFGINQITDKTLKHIAQRTESTNLQFLTINDCDALTDDGIKYLTNSLNLDKLSKFTLNECDGITMESVIEIFRSRSFPRLYHFNCNKPPIVCTEQFIYAFLQSPSKRLSSVYFKLKKIPKESIQVLMAAKDNYLKRFLISRIFRKENLKLIDDGTFKALIDAGQLGFCCRLPELMPNCNLTSASAELLVSKSQDPDFQLNIPNFLEYWNYLIEDNVLLKMCESQKLKNYLVKLDLNNLRQINKQGFKLFIEQLKTQEELESFLNYNQQNIDDDLFEFITKQPIFQTIKTLVFSDFKKLTLRGIKHAFISSYSNLTLGTLLRTTTFNKDQIEGDTIAKAFNSPNFDFTSFKPNDFKHLTPNFIDSFFTSNHVDKVKELHLAQNWVNKEALHFLATDHKLKSLEILRISQPLSKKYNSYMVQFIESKNFQKIKELYLSNCEVSTKFFEALATSEYVDNLSKLHLEEVTIDTEDEDPFSAFFDSKKLVKLSEISLFGVLPLAEEVLRDLANANFTLRTLMLGKFNEDKKYRALKYLASEPNFSNLTSLHLHDMTNFDDKLLIDIADSKSLVNLESLTLSNLPNIRLDGFTKLINSENCKKLERLELKLNQLTDLWLLSLSTSQTLGLLKELILEAYDEITRNPIIFNKGFRNLILSKNLLNLNMEFLIATHPLQLRDDIIINDLCTSFYVKMLNDLDLRECNITSASIIALLNAVNLGRFKLADFLERHKEKMFINDEVYINLKDFKFSQKLGSIDFRQYKGITIKVRLEEIIREYELNQPSLDRFLVTNANTVDDEFISILVNNQAKIKKFDLVVRLRDKLHYKVTKKGLNLLIDTFARPFTLDYDWILTDAGWRKLLEPKSLIMISQTDPSNLDYVDNLDFSTNNFITSNGYQHLMRQHVNKFIHVNDLEANDKYLLNDSTKFLEKLSDQRFNIERIQKDDECGEALLTIIEKCQFLKKINLDNKNFGDNFLKSLSCIISKASIEKSCFLEEVYIRDNPRTSSIGLKYLYTAVVGNNTLKKMETECSDELKTELNTVLNYGLNFAIKQKFEEYSRYYKTKGLALYDKLCMPIFCYAVFCFPFACIQCYGEKIKKKIQNMRFLKWMVEKVTGCIQILSGVKKRKKEDMEVGIQDEKRVEREKFIFTKNMIKLNYTLNSNLLLAILFLNFIIYYVVAIFVPIHFVESCQTGHQVEAYYIYAGYAAFAFILESTMYFLTVKIVDDKSILSTSIQDLIPLITSQNAKFDFFTDMIFMTQKFECQHYNLARASLVVMIVNIILNTNYVLKVFLKPIYKKLTNKTQKKQFQNAAHINKMTKLCLVLEFHAIGHVLDRFSTSSARKFRDTYLPQIMLSTIFKFFFEDIPQTIILIIDILTNRSSVAILSLLSTVLSLVLSFNAVLSAKPSVCTPEMLSSLAQKDRNQDFFEIEKKYEDTFSRRKTVKTKND